LTVGPFDNDDSDQEEILRKYEPYIRSLARKQFPHNRVHPDLLDLDIDEVVQNVRVKLWLTLLRERVISIRAYIRSIVHSVIVDMIRKYEPAQSLPLDEDGELYQGDLIAAAREDLRDPAHEVEEKEFTTDLLGKTVDGVLDLPSSQQRAMICSLKDQIDDLLLLVEAFKVRDVDIEAVNWPEGKSEVQKLRVSLSIARKKLRTSLYPRIVSK